MKRQRYDNKAERQILIGMIVDDVVLGRIASKYRKNMFKSKYANLIAKWCVNFYKKYEDMPMNQIEHLFESWSAKTNDKDTIKLVAKFLDSLSQDYEELATESNSAYIIDIAGTHFNKVKLEKHTEKIQGDIERGLTDEAVSTACSFNQIEMGIGESIDVLQDKEAIKECFKEKGQSLIQYPGAVGKFIKRAMGRDCFVSFMGPEGRGKSFFLEDVAFRGMLQRKKVAYFEAGDMSQNQVMARLMARVCKRPIFPKEFDYPITIQNNGDYSVSVDHDERIYKKKLSWQDAKKTCKKIMKNKIKSRDPYLKLSCHPNSTLSVSMIQDRIENWTRENWVPDIIVIDYADILLMNGAGLEGRDLINDTWKKLRSLSQKYHCLVVTATQADASSYDEKGVITRKNFSEDKRKLAHVTGMIGINQTDPEEKDLGVMRLNWIKLRDEDFSEKAVVWVAGCLSIANPIIRSTF
jgi:replicative DNA helicase